MKYELMISKLEKTTKASQFIYKILVGKKESSPAKSQEKWQSECTEVNWRATYLLTRQCTSSSRLMDLRAVSSLLGSRTDCWVVVRTQESEEIM